jgi:hypothetical protein
MYYRSGWLKNLFAVELAKERGRLRFDAGYSWKLEERNSDRFVLTCPGSKNLWRWGKCVLRSDPMEGVWKEIEGAFLGTSEK